MLFKYGEKPEPPTDELARSLKFPRFPEFQRPAGFNRPTPVPAYKNASRPGETKSPAAGPSSAKPAAAESTKAARKADTPRDAPAVKPKPAP